MRMGVLPMGRGGSYFASNSASCKRPNNSSFLVQSLLDHATQRKRAHPNIESTLTSSNLEPLTLRSLLSVCATNNLKPLRTSLKSMIQLYKLLDPHFYTASDSNKLMEDLDLPSDEQLDDPSVSPPRRAIPLHCFRRANITTRLVDDSTKIPPTANGRSTNVIPILSPVCQGRPLASNNRNGRMRKYNTRLSSRTNTKQNFPFPFPPPEQFPRSASNCPPIRIVHSPRYGCKVQFCT